MQRAHSIHRDSKKRLHLENGVPGGKMFACCCRIVVATCVDRDPVYVGVQTSLTSSLQAALGNEFSLLEQTDIPLLVPEQGRKYQLFVSNVTVWKKGENKKG